MRHVAGLPLRTERAKHGFLRNMGAMGHTALSVGGTPIQEIVASYGESYSSAHKAGGGEIPGWERDEYQVQV